MSNHQYGSSNNRGTTLPSFPIMFGDLVPTRQPQPPQQPQQPFGVYTRGMEHITDSRDPNCTPRRVNQGGRHHCSFCEQSFPTPSALDTHLRVHNGEKPFLCPKCGKAFSVNSNMNRHLKTH